LKWTTITPFFFILQLTTHGEIQEEIGRCQRACKCRWLENSYSFSAGKRLEEVNEAL